ncbi:RluA family pseudouridine synthase [Roseateles koreensis]|uniref:RluA family pseudouridine synthase n=1 Tax=Roseateles koreensis TaxID=2987526 RepID=A0ABT5KSV3_9BURK|nr:RluA family pseudouridine synthase [Roseateles koreensis]MDC8786017.1 RluA family pseudouridine synthase [Roseateles koreensis]
MPSFAPVFINDDLLVINKPSGLLSVPGRGEDKQDCAIHRVQLHYPEALIVHRLDMATSGLLLMARGPAMQRRLSMSFEARKVHKRYIALVAGRLAASNLADWQEIDLPLIADWPNRPRQKIDFETGKPSITRYRVLSTNNETTRVELEPVTGRTHQLRVHMATLGHPIVGDGLYGTSTQESMRLHAWQLTLAEMDLRFECAPDF